MSSDVIGNGPVSFTDEGGNQKSIPLSLLHFENNTTSALDGSVDKLSLDDAAKKTLKALLKDLIAEGFLKPAPTSPPKPAIVLTAARPGTQGNTIKVAFSYTPTDPTKTTFDAEIKAKATYSGLSSAPTSPLFIEKVLGTESIPGTSPGLVQVKRTDPTKPVSQPAAISPVALEIPSGAKRASRDINDGNSGSAFTLEAWQDGEDGKNITISITDVKGTTFTLIVEWSQPKITPITLANLSSKLTGSGFVIQVSEPKEGGFGIPTPGTIVLNGGSDAKAPVPAEAVAFSS